MKANLQKTRYLYDEKTDLLGSGAFGEVFRAYDIQQGQYVALKRIPKKKKNTNSLQLDQEVQALQKIPWPKADDQASDYNYLIKYYDFNENKTHYNLVMELFENSQELLKIISKGRLSSLSALEIFYQITRGIRGLHSLNIVHRDLKPANILVNLNKPLRVKIVDFGYAKQLQTGLEQFMTVAGSPIYMSPQNIMGIGYDGKANEIWSLGKFPWKAVNLEELTDQLIKLIREQIKLNLQGLDFEIQDIIFDCLQVNEDLRPKADQLVWKVQNRLLQLRQMQKINNDSIPQCNWDQIEVYRPKNLFQFLEINSQNKIDESIILIFQLLNKALDYFTLNLFEPQLDYDDHQILLVIAINLCLESIQILSNSQYEIQEKQSLSASINRLCRKMYINISIEEQQNILNKIKQKYLQLNEYSYDLKYLKLGQKNLIEIQQKIINSLSLILNPNIQQTLNFFRLLIEYMLQ